MPLQWAVTLTGLVLLWSFWVLWRRLVPRNRRPAAVTTGVAVLIVVSVAVGLGRVGRLSGVHGPDDTSRQALRSGRELEVVSKELHGRTWILEYRTRIPKNHHRELETEAEEVWKGMHEEAESAGATEADLFPVEFSSELRFAGLRPWIVSNVSSGVLIVRKQTDGTWRTVHGWPSP